MEEAEFLKQVEEYATLDRVESASAVAYATLTTLGESLPAEEADAAGSQLPDRLADWFTSAGGGAGAPYTPEAFVERVRELEADDARVDEREADRHARSGLCTFALAVSPGELATVRDRLPEGYDDLFDPPAAVGGSPTDPA